MKKSIRYLSIAFINLLLLSTLLALWNDRFEEIIHPDTALVEFAKILGYTTLCLAGMRLLIAICRWRHITQLRQKMKMSVVLTLLISLNLYASYFSKIISHLVTYRDARQAIAQKITPATPAGIHGHNLNINEYHTIAKYYRSITLPAEATHIYYDYEYEDFLPDYLLRLSYDLPLHIKADTLNRDDGQLSKFQAVATLKDKKRVLYEETRR